MTGLFVAGFAIGAFVFWQVSKHLERFRRARMDFRRAVAGIQTLVEMMLRRSVDALKWAVLGGVVVVLVTWLLARGTR